MILCEGMRDCRVPRRYGPWTPTNGVIPVDDESLPDLKQRKINLDSEESEAHHPCRDKLKTKRNSPHVGIISHVQPNTN